MTAVLILGLVMNAIALPIAGKRVLFLYRLITHGQPAPDRVAGVTRRLGAAAKRQVVEVFGQRKMLKWSVPGTAHFFVMWAFLILATVYLEAYAALIARDPQWHWFVFNNWGVLGFLQDFIAVMCTLGLVVFWAIRLRNQPKQMGRKSRFFGSHLGPAYFTLFMIFNVVWTMFLFRGAVAARDMATGEEGYGKAAFVSHLLGKVLPDSTALIGIGLLLHIGVMLVFLIFVLNSKHLHIFMAPINILFGREPVALGAAKPLISDGKPVTLDDIDDLDEDAKLGVGAVEDFTWKGLLDMATCTECGRCQSQCPAWNTEKPLSPKLMIMALRDAAFAKAPYLLADEGKREGLLEGNATLTKEVERPLIGETGDEWFYMPEDGSGVLDPDVLWSCVTCGACVNQCPVDIEHVDHIIDMRRYQVLVESNFPSELNQLFRGLENNGNPWNMSPNARMDWAKGLDFEVKVVGETIESLDEVDWLFWVGCAGAYEDRAKKTTRAVAELLDIAGVSFGVLGNGETCTGDSARRAGNEFVFQGLAQQNVETFKEYRVKKVVSTCAHCFNTLKNEYKEFGIELEVVHHTQLLNRLVREGKLTPVREGAGAHKRTITYHDPCYIGRHNGVYTPPRELLQVLPGAQVVEMERNSERSFCCGAGGARMWMEETIGERINDNRTIEAVGTGADQIAVGCPFCRVMLSDGLTAQQDKGAARAEVEVLDVAQMLLASVKGEMATRYAPGSGGAAAPAARSVETKAEPEAGDVTQTTDTVTETAEVGPAAKASGGTSLFDTPAPAEEEAEPAPAPPASSGGSLFDLGGDAEPEPKAAEPAPQVEQRAPASVPEAPAAEKPAQPDTDLGSGGSLFDIAADEPKAAEPAPEAEQRAPANAAETPAAEKPAQQPQSEIDLGSGGSLFDIAAPEEPQAAEPTVEEPKAAEPTAAEPKAAPAKAPEPQPEIDLSSGGSLFDIAAPDPQELSASATAAANAAVGEPEPEPEAAAEPEPEPAAEPEPEPEAEQPEEPAAEEKPQPQASGEAHQPKTDVDIHEAGSLFDL
ncbi:heterodisulfide reductase-related iron-sulfur binding cluster [Nocardioides sp. T2.26MG-1]|uniref:heterodisulfide reductase-related iron-sulfur binding cluster n=1 Tax=Nocardioides sp. T2.26MG-1 TaxID=3041166 RepID=UPI002477992D|nr:heterodisulfide reductase-related iron-sulfur binding cluster [Nocardioides sp. T2.26MG-1]CAI9412043.1 Lactate utilization protein A [Nocardioides sp. T2.26MG-1]